MVTNKIFVSGPRLHPIRVRQRKELETYFSQFGKILHVTMHTVMFDNCDSAAKCIQQKVHKILSQDYVVRRGRPTKSMRKRLRANLEQSMPRSSSENAPIPNSQIPLPAGLTNKFFVAGPCLYPTQGTKDKFRENLRQNMSGPSSDNVSGPNVQGNSPAESNLGNQSPQSTASSSTEGSVIYCGTVSGDCPQSYGPASFDKPALAKLYIAAPKVWSINQTISISKSCSDLFRGYGYQ